MSVQAMESDTDNEEMNRDERDDSTPSFTVVPSLPEDRPTSPEDIADVALVRIFDEDSYFPASLQAMHGTALQKRAVFNEDLDSTTGRVYPKTPMVRSPATGLQQTQPQGPTSQGHGAPKSRHKSPSSRPHSPHPPLTREGILNWGANDSVRKTRSTALPALINTTWPRSGTASTPELKVEDPGVSIEPLPSLIGRDSNRRVYLVRTMCYYNFRLMYLILNCIVLVAGFIYLGGAIALRVHEETILIVVDFGVYLSSVSCLFGVAIILLTLAVSGLCFVRRGPRKTACHAGFSLLMGAAMVTLAFLQSASQPTIQADAELRMRSTIQPELTAKDIWNYFHETFKCCGVRGYLDWCQKVNFGATPNYTSAENFLGSFTCKLPESCCEDYNTQFIIPEKIRHTTCVLSPTPFNTHRTGCLTPVTVIISYLGKMYRVMNFGTAVVLLLMTTTSMVLFTYL